MKKVLLATFCFLFLCGALDAGVIEGISLVDRLEFEKQTHQKWEHATSKERAQFLSGRSRKPKSKSAPAKKRNPSSVKSIFGGESQKTSTHALPLKESHRSMNGY